MNAHSSLRLTVAPRLSRLRSDRGQSIVEFAICCRFSWCIVLGVVETANALIDQHIVTKTAREGSNLISRETRLTDAGTAHANMSSNPVNFQRHDRK